jgi:2-polyprenyl-3-methyl-5-hydroxy-6-metoxy-1,4-benzoquinol methylase
MKTAQLDQKKSEDFSEKLIDILNNGAIALMISIGHRTGLFDTMAGLHGATSLEVASAAGLNERYVREWLGAMVVGGIIEYDQEGKTYTLPPEHAAWLTRKATPDNIAVFAQYIPLLGTVEDQIVECFQNGGGVPYEKYHRFHEVMAEDSGQTVVSSLVESILPLANGLVDRMKSGIDVLDIGCGSGRAVNTMARAFPNSRFTGYDLSREAISAARIEAERSGLTNTTFGEIDLTDFFPEIQYQLITAFDAIHDQARPDVILKNVAHALHPDGVFLMQDIAGSKHVHKNMDHPVGPLLYTISCMHCMSVSLAQGGAGLGAMWGEETAIEMLKEAGFNRTEVKRLPHDFQNSFYINTLK